MDVGAWYRGTQRRLNGTTVHSSNQNQRDESLRLGDNLRGSFFHINLIKNENIQKNYGI